VGGAFRLASVTQEDISKVPWTIDCADYVVTASHPMKAVEQVFEHHSQYGRDWVFNDKGQRVIFVCPLADWRNYTPGAIEPEKLRLGSKLYHLIGY
jgi:hypothetical protein